MDAFFFIDKPSGCTSFQVLRDMRRILWIKKLWHTGTLDPLATGGLLVAIGQYTKLIPYFEKDTKSYRAIIMLDGTSDSYDIDTPVRYISQQQQKYFLENISQNDIQHIFEKHFSWEITQVPPKYSALKINGKRALDRVKAGEDIEMKTRRVEIFSWKIVWYSYPELIVDITVSAGTYIRSIASDLGEILWTGAYLSWLRRTSVGDLKESQMTQLSELSQESQLNLKKIFPSRIFDFSDELIYRRLQDWQRVLGEFNLPKNMNIFLSHQGIIRYIVEYKDGVLHPRKKVV